MKTILTFILLFAIALPCSGLTQQDLEQIERLIDKKLEPIKIDIANIKGKMATKDDIIAVRKDFTEEMNAFRREIYAKIDDIDTKIDSTSERTNTRIDSLYIALIAVGTTIIIVAILASIFVGPIFNKWLERREERKSAIVKIREIALELVKDKPEWAEAYKNIGLL